MNDQNRTDFVKDLIDDLFHNYKVVVLFKVWKWLKQGLEMDW